MKDGIVLFDAFAGFGGAELSAKYAGVKVKKRYICEVDKNVLKVLKKHYPDAIFVGDIRDLNPKDFSDVTHFCGGSPCQSLSFAGLRQGLVTKENIVIDSLELYKKLKRENFEFKGQSYLYFEYLRMLNGIRKEQDKLGIERCKFLLENVVMKKKWEDIITKTLGVKPIRFNASLVSAQNRDRLFWTDFADNIKLPQDQNVKLSDVIDDAVNGVGFRGRKMNGSEYYSYPKTVRNDNKANCLVTTLGNVTPDGRHFGTGYYQDKKGKTKLLTVEQAEIIQGLKSGYTNVEGVSKTARIKMIGNGWSIPVTGRLFEYIKKNTKTLKSK